MPTENNIMSMRMEQKKTFDFVYHRFEQVLYIKIELNKSYSAMLSLNLQNFIFNMLAEKIIT